VKSRYNTNAGLADPVPKLNIDAVPDLARSPVTTSRCQAWLTIDSEYLMLYREIDDWHSGAKPNPRIRPDFLSTGSIWLGRETKGSA
jgi:hypothetical protein